MNTKEDLVIISNERIINKNDNNSGPWGGNGNNQNPWGRKPSNNQNQPDMDEILRQSKDRYKKYRSRNCSYF